MPSVLLEDRPQLQLEFCSARQASTGASLPHVGWRASRAPGGVPLGAPRRPSFDRHMIARAFWRRCRKPVLPKEIDTCLVQLSNANLRGVASLSQFRRSTAASVTYKAHLLAQLLACCDALGNPVARKGQRHADCSRNGRSNDLYRRFALVRRVQLEADVVALRSASWPRTRRFPSGSEMLARYDLDQADFVFRVPIEPSRVIELEPYEFRPRPGRCSESRSAPRSRTYLCLE